MTLISGRERERSAERLWPLIRSLGEVPSSMKVPEEATQGRFPRPWPRLNGRRGLLQTPAGFIRIGSDREGEIMRSHNDFPLFRIESHAHINEKAVMKDTTFIEDENTVRLVSGLWYASMETDTEDRGS